MTKEGKKTFSCKCRPNILWDKTVQLKALEVILQKIISLCLNKVQVDTGKIRNRIILCTLTVSIRARLVPADQVTWC